MEQGKIVYHNRIGWGECIITEHPGIKDYKDKIINENDKVYRIAVTGNYQLEIKDCAEIVYYLLKNKVKDNKFAEYRMEILDAINRAKFYRKRFFGGDTP